MGSASWTEDGHNNASSSSDDKWNTCMFQPCLSSQSERHGDQGLATNDKAVEGLGNILNESVIPVGWDELDVLDKLMFTRLHIHS